MLRFGNETVVESVYFNIVLQYILEQSLGGARSISEIDILNLIFATAKIFKIQNILRQLLDKNCWFHWDNTGDIRSKSWIHSLSLRIYLFFNLLCLSL